MEVGAIFHFDFRWVCHVILEGFLFLYDLIGFFTVMDFLDFTFFTVKGKKCIDENFFVMHCFRIW